MKFPETLNDITLNSYQKYLEREEEATEEDFIKDMLDINDYQLSNFKLSEINTLVSHFDKLFKEEPKFKPTFEMDGVKYGFIPKLDDITYGENKDLTSYINDFKTMHKAMAVAYRPIKHKQGKKYLIDDYEGSHLHSEQMKNAPLDVVLGMNVFFYDLISELLNLTPSYLEKELEKETILPQNGEDLERYIALLREMLDDLKR